MPPKQDPLRVQQPGPRGVKRGGRRARGDAVPGAPPGDRRDRLRLAATRRFAEFGFEATTVRQIADDVSILSGSLYHHFATKEEILDEIVREAVLQAREQALRIAALPLDAEQRLVALVMAELHRLTSNQEVYAIVFNERKFFRRSEFFQYLVMAKKDSYDAWRKVLEEGVAEGLFNADTDIYLTISTVIRMLNTGADWFKNEDGSVLDALEIYSLERLLDFYLGFVLRSIRVPERVGQPIVRPAVDC
jgi:AcrR family transcriptional regulator